MNTPTLAFIGGGNMAAALIGGLLQAGAPASSILVVEPLAAQGESLRQRFGVRVAEAAGTELGEAQVVVWAVKPQTFVGAAAASSPHFAREALHISVMAGVRCAAIARRTGAQRIVRAMPNTPALIGQGVAGLYASPQATGEDRASAEHLLKSTGQWLWVDDETQLDVVTALSGSGPAYVFYLLEALIESATRMGLAAESAKQLALGTFAGATALAAQSAQSPATLREQVTSKGGTTAAALDVLAGKGVAQAFDLALHAAAKRAAELGDELG